MGDAFDDHRLERGDNVFVPVAEDAADDEPSAPLGVLLVSPRASKHDERARS
jgi:hypothetical protein